MKERERERNREREREREMERWVREVIQGVSEEYWQQQQQPQHNKAAPNTTQTSFKHTHIHASQIDTQTENQNYTLGPTKKNAPEVRAVVSDSTSSINTHTSESFSSTSSRMCVNSLITSFPLSENHLENSECALISINCPNPYTGDSRMVSRCARA
jgi:hypothetical protein